MVMLLRLAVTIAAILLMATSAQGRSNGITGQYQNGCGGGGCHGGAANNNTVLTLTGPTTVKAGSTSNYTFRVAHNDQAAAGLNIAFLAPAGGPTGTLTGGAGTQVNGSQITHTEAKDFDNNNGADFTLSWTAPETHGIYTFAGAGNAVNDANGAGGDVWNTMNQQIIVTGATLTSPTSGSFCQGNVINVKWTHTGITTLRIELSSDNFQNVTVIGTTVDADDEQYDYTIPNDQQPATTYRIRLVDVRTGDELDRTDGFAIAGGPNILTQPEDTEVCTGRTLQLTVGATGSDPTFQWRKDGQNIAGATTGILRITTVKASDAGTYDCVINSCDQSVTSDPAEVTINIPPTIVEHPQGVDVCDGERVELAVDATGSDLTYQWLRNGVPVAGATSRTYNIPGVSDATEGVYQCRITGACSPQRTTDSAIVNIIDVPSITMGPEGADLTAGDDLSLMVTADGENLMYQWYKDGEAIDGATESSFSITGVVRSDSGMYTVRIWNRCDTTESERATVTVKPAAGPGVFVLGTDAVDMGQIPVCGTKDTTLVGLLKNEGGTPIVVTGATVSPMSTIELVDVAFPITIDAGSSESVMLRVRPEGSGPVTGAVEFAEEGGAKTMVVSGTAVDVASVTPDTLRFPDNSSGEVRCLTLGATECPEYQITSVSFSGDGADAFAPEAPLSLPITVTEGMTSDICIKTVSQGTAEATVTVATTAGTITAVLVRDVISSVDEFDPTVISGLTVAPNPTRDEVRITSPNGALMNIRVHNLMGAVVQTLQGAGEVLWDGRDQTGSRVAPGMYVLMIEQGLRTQVVKLLVE